MSGDLGPRVVIDACKSILSKVPDLTITVVGDASLALLQSPVDRLTFLSSTQVVEMDDSPSHALRHKKDSSMRKALAVLRDGGVDACVSAGNTGALLLLAHHFIGVQPGVERAAIARVLPTTASPTVLLDLGASPTASAAQLLQFSLMGREWVRALGIAQPRIALLNIGVEAHKGTPVLQEARAQLAAQLGEDFVGFIEANRLFCGDAEVIVSDGFSGNIALKACEGTARFISQKLKNAYTDSFAARLAGLVSWVVLRKLKRELNPSGYNGALILGLNQVVVKSHGDADANAMESAIALAYQQAKCDLPRRIATAIAAPLG